MNILSSRRLWLWLPIVLAAMLVIYLPGLGNLPVFDDSLLTSGSLFSKYADLFPLKPRLFSYGSFLWIQDVFGEGWWKQRLVNLAIHACVVLALWGLYRDILRHIQPAPDEAGGTDARTPYHQSPALGFALGFFALNPVAVYAVAYLIQRSILLATLFVVLALWLFVRGVANGKPVLFLLALLCYALAVMSKEHAIMTPLAAVPLYLLAARPGARRLGLIAGGGAALVALIGLIFTLEYAELIGKPFDEFSRIYLAQLAQLGPDVDKHAYLLSIINQAYFFFQYGLHWFVPYAGWMSIDMRPPFPVTWFSFPQILGVVGYIAVLAGGFLLLGRHRDWRALIGLSILLPALLFLTEFATVWVQDPFVLYRGYLWAIGIPGLVFFLLHGLSPRALLLIGLVLGGLFTWQALDRVSSLATPERVWTDAIAKLPDDPRSVGRWFPYLNRGSLYLERDQLTLAANDFAASAALGDKGMGMYNIGSLHALAGNYHQAVDAYDQAEKQGYNLYPLPYQRAQALQALGKLPEAFQQFARALELNPPPLVNINILFHMGQTALRLGDTDAAIQHFKSLLQHNPSHQEAKYSLAMAHILRAEYAQARELLTQLLGGGEQGPVHYGLALANHGLKRKAEALAAIDNAIRIGPDNPNLHLWQARIRAMP